MLLGVDDGHLLDAASAALVLHLAASGTAFVVVTVRAGEPCPDPVVALWKDAGALRLELQQLSQDETAGLLAAALGGEVEPGVLRWAFEASEGNVLYLRELVTGALAAGALQRAGGQWQLRFRPHPGPALVDLISARLAGLTEEELDTVRLLALGEPLPVGALARIAGTAALARLEERGLAVVTPAGKARPRAVRRGWATRCTARWCATRRRRCGPPGCGGGWLRRCRPAACSGRGTR